MSLYSAEKHSNSLSLFESDPSAEDLKTRQKGCYGCPYATDKFRISGIRSPYARIPEMLCGAALKYVKPKKDKQIYSNCKDYKDKK